MRKARKLSSKREPRSIFRSKRTKRQMDEKTLTKSRLEKIALAFVGAFERGEEAICYISNAAFKGP